MSGPQKSALSDPYDIGWVLDDDTGYTLDEAYAFLTGNKSGAFAVDVPALLTASANPVAHTGAMVALIPSREDLARLALEDGEPLEELHLTLAYLGEADQITDEMRADIISAVGSLFTTAVTTEAFSVNVFNPHNPDMQTAVVLGIRGEDLVAPQADVMSTVRGMYSGMPENHKPWIPHVTLKYTEDVRKEDQEAFLARLGSVKFDTLRFAFAGEVHDMPLDDPDDPEDVLTAAATALGVPAHRLLAASVTVSQSDLLEPVEEEERFAAWDGVLAMEGVESGDGRMFRLGSLDFDRLPIPLMYQPANTGGHSGSVMVGQIQKIFRDDNQIMGMGIIDLEAKMPEGFEIGKEVFRLMSENFLTGVSVDVDKVKDGDVTHVYNEGEPKPRLTVFNNGRVRGATLVAFPAFTEARVHLTGDVMTSSAWQELDALLEDCGCDVPLTAATHTITIPDIPPAAWFEKPSKEELKGAFTITDEGRVFGCLAPAGVTHRSVKRKVPMKTVDYTRFMGKETIVASADTTFRMRTGSVTFDCGHAETNPQVYGTLENRRLHYDNSCSVFADIVIGEDPEMGVWVAGAVKPFADGEQIQKAMGCTLSGDWQPHPDRPGVTEFIAALLVPVPGFAMARRAASVTFNEDTLVASAVPVEFSETKVLELATRKKSMLAERDGLDFASRKLELEAQLGLMEEGQDV